MWESRCLTTPWTSVTGIALSIFTSNKGVFSLIKRSIGRNKSTYDQYGAVFNSEQYTDFLDSFLDIME
jgi:hypothetical protein